MFGRFFDTSTISRFAADLVADLRKDLPVELCEADSKAARRARDAAQARTRRHVEAFAVSHSLNLYQKAKLGIVLQGALEGAGYPATFAKAYGYDVVSQVAQAAAARQ